MFLNRTILALSISIMLAACGTFNAAQAAPDATATTSSTASLSTNYAERADVKKFVDQINAKHNYSKTDLLNAFAQAERMDIVLR